MSAVPAGIDKDELIMWAPIMAEPSLASLREMEDGTYSLDDVLKMNLALKFKADQIKDSMDG